MRPHDQIRCRDISAGCACCGVSRRQFLAGCAAGAAGLSTLGIPRAVAADPTDKARIGLVFSHRSTTRRHLAARRL